ncbi:hypothetical protein [Micromonospora globbae]|uniref:hypothetical protein n=1 Tax=Micromonospora globbae TaxID=1894969 RepID=UPI0013151BAE|nr:hypothetical protein [Micromonospora globbae]
MLARTAEIAELAVAVSQVEVQRRVQAGHRQRHPGLGDAGVAEQVGGGERPLIPDQLLVDVVLHVGHRVREDAHVQGIAPLPADLVPDLREQVPSRLALALMVVQRHALADPDEGGVGGHLLLLHGSTRDDGIDRSVPRATGGATGPRPTRPDGSTPRAAQGGSDVLAGPARPKRRDRQGTR